MHVHVHEISEFEIANNYLVHVHVYAVGLSIWFHPHVPYFLK